MGNNRVGKATLALLLAVLCCKGLSAEIRKFKVNQSGARNLGVWRLTHDPAVRDEANYHNIQCWSPNGRYTCYTHWVGTDGPGGKASAEVHVVDLSTDEGRLVDKGINPRWATQRNWLFFCHRTGDGKPPYETGTQVVRYDADTGEKVVITHGVECPGGTDSADTWLFGTQRYRGQKPEYVTVRVRNEPGNKLEVLKSAPNLHAYVNVNPRHPIIKVRARDYSDKLYGTNRAFFDLDGANVRKATVICEEGHKCWSGDGEYLLIGNGQPRGRPWNKPFPSDLVMLSYDGVGDICPCGNSGRYLCGGNLNFVDTRSGDCWPVVNPHSSIIYPMEGDFSTLMDIDPKGSPDGTKIHYHSTRDIENAAMERVTAYDAKKPDVIHVDSPAGFPDSGDMVCGPEVVGYAKKTATTFEGLTRRKYGTRPAPDMVLKVRVIFPLSAFLLSDEDKKRAKPDGDILARGFPKDYPLLYQRQTDCYIVVTRLPFRPHLRLKGNRVELIPGEHHWETRGYRLLRDGQPVQPKLFALGESFVLPQPGTYTATAVEWSGLESPPSLALKVEGRAEGSVLKGAPADFSWTTEVRKDGGSGCSVVEVVHLHDGVIAREEWQGGQKLSRVDLNEDGKPIRVQEFENGKLKKRTYRTPEGHLASEELFGPDGFKTEYIRYYTDREDRRGKEHSHWWYDRGRPVKKTERGKVVFDTTKP